MNNNDLAGEEYWSDIYQTKKNSINSHWFPADYNSIVLDIIIKTGINKCNPQSILEVGCGGSVWLPYLARLTGAKVAGIDYSDTGCKIAKDLLINEGILGDVYCMDLFSEESNNIGEFDFVYSLGVIEHFRNQAKVLQALKKFVKPGGILLTEIPNLYSFHGILGWLWQPKVLARHQLIQKHQLISEYVSAGFTQIECKHMGRFSLNMLAYGVDSRFPRLEKKIMPYFQKVINFSENRLQKNGKVETIIPFFAPFIYVIGRRL